MLGMLVPGKHGELLTESKKVQSRHFLNELFSGRDRRTKWKDMKLDVDDFHAVQAL